MMPRPVPAYALLLALLLGCSPSTPTTLSVSPGPAEPEPTPRHSRPTHRDREKPKPPPAVAPMNPAITRTKETGVIRGRVLSQGGKGVADVGVWISKPELKSPEPTEPVALVQARERYSPRVLFARIGQQLEVRTTDDRADFHASGGATFSDNLTRGQVRSHRLMTPGTIEVRSQLHPDMAPARVYVVSHDWHAISEGDGTFRLPPLPPGEYSVTLVEGGGEGGAGRPQTQVLTLKLDKGEGTAIEWTLPGK